MSSAGQAAFYSGQMVLDLGEGWAVQADRYNNTFRLDSSPLRLYQEEQAQLAEREREKRAALAAEIGARPPIPKDVQVFVWQRDGGRCVQCASNPAAPRDTPEPP